MHLHLDRSLPAPLDTVGSWLHEAEGALRQEDAVPQGQDVTTATSVHRALEHHKVSQSSTPEGEYVCLSSEPSRMILHLQDLLKSLKSHQQVFQRIHNDRSVNGVPVLPDQLQDLAER